MYFSINFVFNMSLVAEVKVRTCSPSPVDSATEVASSKSIVMAAGRRTSDLAAKYATFVCVTNASHLANVDAGLFLAKNARFLAPNAIQTTLLCVKNALMNVLRVAVYICARGTPKSTTAHAQK